MSPPSAWSTALSPSPRPTAIFPRIRCTWSLSIPGSAASAVRCWCEAGRHLFVGPDNGVFSFIYEREERVTVRHITASHYFLQPVSRTFHGRDIFSPIAAWLTKGIAPSRFGDPIGDYRRIANLNPTIESDQRARGMVLKADKFGNLITNFSLALFPQFVQPESPSFRLEIKGQQLTRLRKTFSEGAPGEVFAIVGSSGYLEIVCNGAAASRALNAGSGDEIVLTFQYARPDRWCHVLELAITVLKLI